MRRWTLSLLTVIFTSNLHALQPFRPRGLDDMGHFTLSAAVLVECDIAWVNYSALRRDFPILQRRSDRFIDRLIMDNFCKLTRDQVELNGIFQSDLIVRQLSAARKHKLDSYVYHPSGYHRASNIFAAIDLEPDELTTPELLENLYLHSDGRYYLGVDAKGTGRNKHARHSWWLGDLQEALAQKKIPNQLLVQLQEELKKFKKYYEEFQEVLKALERRDTENEQSADKALILRFTGHLNPPVGLIRQSNNYCFEDITNFTELLKLVTTLHQAWPPSQVPVEKIFAVLRELHHSNGLVDLAEGVGEINRQRVEQVLLNEWNTSHGTNHQTLDSYFLAVPKGKLLSNGKRSPGMAIVGRQLHWALEHRMGLELPATLVADPNGFFQRDALDAHLDYEAVELFDPRLNGLFLIDPQKRDPDQRYGGRRLGRAVSDQYIGGDHGAIERHLNDIVKLLPDLPHFQNAQTAQRERDYLAFRHGKFSYEESLRVFTKHFESDPKSFFPIALIAQVPLSADGAAGPLANMLMYYIDHAPPEMTAALYEVILPMFRFHPEISHPDLMAVIMERHWHPERAANYLLDLAYNGGHFSSQEFRKAFKLFLQVAPREGIETLHKIMEKNFRYHVITDREWRFFGGLMARALKPLGSPENKSDCASSLSVAPDEAAKP